MKSRLLLGILLVAACRDKPAQQSAGSGSGSAVGSGSGSGSGSAKVDPDVIMLPKLSGRPPKKTTKPLTKEESERLSKIEIKSFTQELRRADEVVLNVRHKVTARPLIDVTVYVQQCKPTCIPMDVEQWRAQKPILMEAELAKDLQEAKDTVFEIGEATLGGQKLIYQYQLGWNLGRNETGVIGSYTHSYLLFHNDGVNQIRVRVNYADDPPVSAAALTTLVPRAQLETIASTFVDVYTQAWAL